MPFIAEVNDDALLYRGPDGREAWVFLKPGEVTIVTDIHGDGPPANAVPFRLEDLRKLVEIAERA